MNTFKYLQSTLSEGEDLDAELTHRVQNGWKNWKRMCGVFGDENEREDPYGKLYRTLVGPALDERAETLKKAEENKLGIAEI